MCSDSKVAQDHAGHMHSYRLQPQQTKHVHHIKLGGSATLKGWRWRAQLWTFKCIQSFRFLQPKIMDHPFYQSVVAAGKSAHANQIFMVRGPPLGRPFSSDVAASFPHDPRLTRPRLQTRPDLQSRAFDSQAQQGGATRCPSPALQLNIDW
jgi:hypothetical protein